MSLLKNIGIILGFIGIIIILIMLAAPGFLFYLIGPISFFKGYFIKENKKSKRIILLVANLFFILLVFYLLLAGVIPQQEEYNLMEFAEIFFITFCVIIDLIFFPMGVGFRNPKKTV